MNQEAPPGNTIDGAKADTRSPAGSRTPQQQRRRLLYLSAFLFIVLPSVLATIYYTLVAADQYAVEVRFAVRGPEASQSSDVLGMFTGISAAGSTVVDSYILMDYLHSRQILESLSGQIDMDAIFNSPKADLLAAFSVKSNPIEYFVDYWKDMLRVDFDSTSKIIALEIKTFDPKHSKQLADEVLKLSEALVNKLSERSRQDAVKTAKLEVDRMEDRMRKSLGKIRQFREKNQDIDPAQSATAQLSRLSAIETQLNAAKTQLAAQKTFMSESSPAVQFTRAKIKALKEQVAAERAKLGPGASPAPNNNGTLSGIVEDYQALATEVEFAQKAYLSSLTSLEQARLTANQQQRYLGVFVLPSLPQKALYPNRAVSIATIAVFSVFIWGILVLMVYAIRDHMA